jgi:phosphoglycerate dehydrogenase-like enzyme
LSPDADEVFRVADWLILTAPLTPATDRMVNRRTLSLMKRTAYLVNTARGGLVDEDALCDALRSKRIAGAALDAFAEEPLPADSPLRKLELLMTPHIAATTIETSANVSRIVARNVAAVLLDGATDVAVNAGLIPRPTEASTQ